MKMFFAKSIAILGLFIAVNTATAQNITYTVKPGDNLSAIAKQYKLSVLQIISINKLKTEALQVGQKLVIPTGNIGKTAVANTAAKYTVVAGDNLTKIAKQFNVTEKQLLEWNNLSNDVIRVGQVLTIASQASKPVIKPAVTTPKPVTAEVEQVKPVVEKTITKTNEVAKATTPAPTNTTPVQAPVSIKVKSFFEDEFVATGNKLTSKANTFKTATGWMDKKYYVLSNTINLGTVVKLSFNGKTTYAKVLGVIPEQAGTAADIKLSSAAASAIGAHTAEFLVEVAY